MNSGLTNRLNQILPKITSDAFLSGKGMLTVVAEDEPRLVDFEPYMS